MTDQLAGKTAIVTGAAKGIGRGIAIEMAKEGADIVIVDLPVNHKMSEETLELVTANSVRGMVYDLDITHSHRHQELVEKVAAEMGKIDIMVNNAGIGGPKGGLLKTDEVPGRMVMETNFLGPFFLTQRVVKYMIQEKISGVVLFTSSTHSQVTMLKPMYAASKAAVEMLVKDAALELAEHKIRVNAVAPGAISTDGARAKDRRSKHVPMEYAGTPEDIGKAMVFLASDSASYITGQTLVVDGGFSLAHTHYWIKKGIL